MPLDHTQIEANISGGVAHVTVEQVFLNRLDRAIEAEYVFPLPHRAAVDRFEMHMGARALRGSIRRREMAEEDYQAARQRGQVAAQLDQERPNIFTQRIANIQPGHDVRVRIRYFDQLQYRDSGYEMVIPTVVGPRYSPGSPILDDVSPTGRSVTSSLPRYGKGDHAGALDTDRVPDAARMSPPVLPPESVSRQNIAIMVHLDAGVGIRSLECPSHAIEVARPTPSSAHLWLRPEDRIPNKDFVLRYRVQGESPEFALLAHRDPNSGHRLGFFSLLLQPKLDVQESETRPKEVIFILDTSGSMAGEPLARSKAAMRWALQHLGRDDTFQILRFADEASTFAAGAQLANPQTVALALKYIEGLQEAQSCTEIITGLFTALEMPPDEKRLRIVCMLTDGYVGNEREVLAAVRQRIGNARLFMFGVGSSVNRYLLDEMAEEGRGAVDYVPLDGDIRPLVERFYDKLSRPYLTEISIDWGDLDVRDVYPARLPDLFAGRPLVVTGQYEQPDSDEIVIRGWLGTERFEQRLRVTLPISEPENPALGTLWARRRIDTLMQRLLPEENENLVEAVRHVGLEFNLLTPYTSFVALDNQVLSTDGKPRLVRQPVELPAGVSYRGVFPLPNSNVHLRRLGLGHGSRSGDAVPKKRSDREIISLPVESIDADVALSLDLIPRQDEKAPTRKDLVRIGGNVEPAKAYDRFLPRLLPETPEAAWMGLQNLRATIDTESATMLPGERVRLVITLRNVGQATMHVPTHLLSPYLGLDVLRDGEALGMEARTTSWQPPSVILEPGETREYRVVLENVADFAVRGHYEIALTRVGRSILREPYAQCEFVVR